jgi:hypothetical protein
MLLRCVASFLFACITLSASAQAADEDPKTAKDWFQHANDRMNLRMPGTTPFHMKVTFHAFPGVELLGAKEKSDFVSGDGVYEETWLAPHQWRREVTLADYHAVEENSAGVRKMQASSDYEPSRVLMLLDALYQPVPRYLVTKDFPRSGWKIDQISNATLSMVRVSRSVGDQRADFSVAYYFSPRGILEIENSAGLTKTWANDFLFSGIVIPGHISIKAGERDLLTADVAVEAAAQVDPATFDLPGGPADPGMTLRPLKGYEVKMPDISDTFRSWVSPGPGNAPVFDFWEVLDRHGRFRELEMILAPNDHDAAIIMTQARSSKHHPPEIDGSPCQVQIFTLVM